MSNMTNQKLFFAQLQLDAFAGMLHKAQTPRERLVAQGHADACILQLMLAYRCFLDEISQAYRLRDLALPEGLGAHVLPAYVEACAKRDVISPELNYLYELSKDETSALTALVQLFEQQYRINESEVKAPGPNEQRINMQALDEIDPLAALLDRLVWIMRHLRSAIEHCRHTLQEY